MYTASRNIDPVTDTIRFLLSVFLSGICNGKLAFENQVRGKIEM
jgi:hypothetical protein